MEVSVSFYSYFKDVTGCARTTQTLPDKASIGDLWSQLAARFPKLEPMQKASLVAVGVDYQDRAFELKDGDEVSLFPPVQGG